MKKFLIIGNANAVANKDIFPHIASGEWFVRTANGKISFVMYFTNGDGEVKKVPSVWFTNLDSRHLYKTIELTKTYNPEKYPKYDNYDAIEVGCIKDIPYDYDGVMGVPISIVLFSPYQFEILGTCENLDLYSLKTKVYSSEECRKAYYEKFGKRGTYDLNASGVIIKNGLKEKVYSRTLIKQVQDKKKVDFEVIGITENADYLKPLYIDGNEKYDRPYINGRRMYPRILIKRVSK